MQISNKGAQTQTKTRRIGPPFSYEILGSRARTFACKKLHAISAVQVSNEDPQLQLGESTMLL